MDGDDRTKIQPPGHACNLCRRRKLRCSRDVPSCQHCRRSASECIYEAKRGKPGMKAGALDNIHRRLDALEHSLGQQQSSLNNLELDERSQDNDTSIKTFLSALEASLQNLNKGYTATSDSRDQNRAPTKRRRVDSDNEAGKLRLKNTILSLPNEADLNQVLELYFTFIHPWTPIIHEGRLRRRLDNEAERERLYILIQAMKLVASRHAEATCAESAPGQPSNQPDDVRDWLVAKAMKQPSVENLQALVIIASADIGDGQASSAWPLVGSLSRMVEYLQLTVEHDEAMQYPFSQPYRYLPPPQDWIEAEERRRVFWSIFTLDRFCSVSMGWNTSLTADDVQRRLPCDGITWRKGDPVVTPYFGIWDKSAGRIGNPIAFLPTHPISARPVTEDEAEALSEAGTSPGTTVGVDMSAVGAFAYCIEATESMSRVTSYFLQQKVNLHDQKEFAAWLTRFKELDIRLVHWKMLLPKKWAVNVVQQASSRMDPNLTLAHITHNASMILLHQPIAFPLPEWPFKSRLPSICSIDTCQTAAIEVASITNQYLKHSPGASPLSSQFAFCVFIAARVLLLSWKHSSIQTDVAVEFWVLTNSLDAMSRRWAGRLLGHQNLAAKYSTILNKLHRSCLQNESIAISVSGYTVEIIQEGDRYTRPGDSQTIPIQLSDAPSDMPELSQRNSGVLHTPSHIGVIHVGKELAPLPQASESSTTAMSTDTADHVPIAHRTEQSIRQNEDGDESMEISQMLLDPEFTDLDRIISFNDGLFGSEFEGQRW
ncbi:fungal-specific transcription factor domain-containing protein [Aspergillus ambiguus]|uniref:Zn(II)2Cys6 transcription factor n=1 Tax=Aspergillus ambiguus TaxID=176160 RepID=UPI003CCDE5F8